MGVRYGMTAALLAIAFLIRHALTPLLDRHSPFLFFLQAAMLASLFAGLGPGIAALLGGMVLGDVLFLKPTIGFAPYTTAELTALISYLITGLIAIGIIERFHHVRTRLERIQAHEQALESEVTARTITSEQRLKSLEGVLYHVAHDLRAPLRAMHSFSCLLLENCDSRLDAAGRDYARRISEASLKMDILVRDLLNYGGLSHREVRWIDIDLWPLADSLIDALAPEIESRRAEIRVHPPSPHVRGDPQILAGALKHLLENALKFVRPGTAPQIDIWAESHDGLWRIYIADNGIGIAPAYQRRIFGVFERGHSSPHYRGTGIGLAIVKKGAERLGGRAGVESKVGEGSRFWLELQAVLPPTRELDSPSTIHREPLRALMAYLRSSLCLTP